MTSLQTWLHSLDLDELVKNQDVQITQRRQITAGIGLLLQLLGHEQFKARGGLRELKSSDDDTDMMDLQAASPAEKAEEDTTPGPFPIFEETPAPEALPTSAIYTSHTSATVMNTTEATDMATDINPDSTLDISIAAQDLVADPAP